LVLGVVGATQGASAAPSPPTISLGGNGDSFQVVDPDVTGNCNFVLAFAANGIKGNPRAGWDVLADVPSHFGPPELISLTTLFKDDNGARQEVTPSHPTHRTHPSDGHSITWVLHLRNPKGDIVATSNAVTMNSGCA
jgi:hypothetical protein